MASQALVLREYERVSIGQKWNPIEKTGCVREVAFIDSHQQRTGRKLFDLAYRSIGATNWVGTYGIDKYCIEVIPKVDEQDDQSVQRNLAYMLCAAGLVPAAPADIARFTDNGDPLLLAFLNIFVELLGNEWRKGQIKDYVVFEDNRSYLKGKLLIPPHIRLNAVHRERFYTSFDEFTADNLVTQLLKAALRICAEQRMSQCVVQAARKLLFEFVDVHDVDLSGLPLLQIQVDRRFARYEMLINMAKFIVSQISPSSSISGEKIYSLLFPIR